MFPSEKASDLAAARLSRAEFTFRELGNAPTPKRRFSPEQMLLPRAWQLLVDLLLDTSTPDLPPSTSASSPHPPSAAGAPPPSGGGVQPIRVYVCHVLHIMDNVEGRHGGGGQRGLRGSGRGGYGRGGGGGEGHASQVFPTEDAMVTPTPNP